MIDSLLPSNGTTFLALSLLFVASSPIAYRYCLAGIVVFQAWQVSRHRKSVIRKDPHSSLCLSLAKQFGDVVPLPDFDWRAAEPLQLRPYKPTYNITMGIRKNTLSEIIQVDRDHFARLSLRKQILSEKRPHVTEAKEDAAASVRELYEFLCGYYLPTRFPSIYQLREEGTLKNIVNGDEFPVRPSCSTTDTLRLLGTLVDEDFMFLLLSPDGEGYRLQAYVVCYASGFDFEKIYGAKLKDIHGPVPRYEDRLRSSMDRFFDRLETGRYVSRQNWAMNLTGNLVIPVGEGHLREGGEEKKKITDINAVHLRAERQTLFRLPESQAIVFLYKTYLYPLRQIRDEGSGPALVQAIAGLKEGNAPEFHTYKGAAVWEEEVERFLMEGTALVLDQSQGYNA